MVNHNVRITFAVRITDGIATGIWASSVLSTYINVLEGDNDQANERVGYAQAIQGTFLAAAAIPAGWLAITHRRDSILKVMGLVAFAAIATTSAALVLDNAYKYGLLCCGLALWGVAQANAPVLDALFADSVPTGNRSKLYTWLHMCYIVAQGIGPGVGAWMFALNGNVWKLEVLQHVMLVGMALAMIPALLMLCFDDDKALGSESEGLLRVALLETTDVEEGWEEEDQGVEEEQEDCGGGRHGAIIPHNGSLSQSPDGGDTDYRQPFLDTWCSDTERDYRNQVSAACSPVRHVSSRMAAATAAAADVFNAKANCYVHPDLVSVTSVGTDAKIDIISNSGSGAASISNALVSALPSVAKSVPASNDHMASTSATPLSPHVGSHALLLSPTTMSPATDRSGMTTPALSSPSPPGASIHSGTNGDCDQFRNVTPGDLAAAGAAVVAAEPFEGDGLGKARKEGAGDVGKGEGPRGSMHMTGFGAMVTAAAMAERFRAVREAVNVAESALVAVPSSCTDDASSYGSCRSIAEAESESRSGSGAGAAPDGMEGAPLGGDDIAVGSSREPSLMADSVPLELSFNSLLGQGSFKSAQSRVFSRTPSSNSCGSARAGGSSASLGSAVLASSAGIAVPPALGLLPHLAEESHAEADASREPDTPTLEPQLQQMMPPSSDQPSPPPYDAVATGAGTGTGAPYSRGGCADCGGGPSVSNAGGISNRQVPLYRAIVGGRSARTRGVVGAQEGGGWRDPPPQLTTAASGLDPLKHRFLCLTMAWIPGVLALTDCIMGLASGMTIKFFPIFFKDAVHLAPMYVNLMYCAIPLCLSTASYLAQRESRILGRVQTMVLNRGIGITLLYWIAMHDNRWHNQRLMVPVYIARTSIMNSIYPLQKSILMDFVPKERRAAWNSLEAVTSFGWSGSAALGGFLIRKFGFRTTFLITATMQCMGWGMSMLLLPIVPRNEAGLQPASHIATASVATATTATARATGASPSTISTRDRTSPTNRHTNTVSRSTSPPSRGRR